MVLPHKVSTKIGVTAILELPFIELVYRVACPEKILIRVIQDLYKICRILVITYKNLKQQVTMECNYVYGTVMCYKCRKRITLQ